MILGICENVDVLKVINIVVIILKIIQIVVPIVLMFSLMLKMIGAMTKKDDDAIASLKKKAVPNIVAAVLIFIVPLLVGIIMNVTLPDSEYTKCIVGISSEKLQQAYEDKAERLVSKAEETLNINDYVNAKNYMPNVKDKDKRRGYEERLEIVKALIDEARKPEEKVDYSNFKWTYYKPGTGPASKIYKNTISYAIYAPEDVSALNGVSLPIMVWLHGAGVTYDIIKDGDKFLSRNIFPMLTNWDQYGLSPIPAIIIAPQAPSKDSHWHTYQINQSIKAMIEYVSEEYNASTEANALAGHSMGGGGAMFVFGGLKGTFKTLVVMSKGDGYIGHAEDYYNIRMRGYDEDCTLEKVFVWAHHADDFVCLKGMKHEDVPIYAFTTDDDGDGESDLVHWMFEEYFANN